MANLISSGSITIRRLRTGYTLNLYFRNLTGVPLYQGVDDTGTPTPKWSTATDADRPQLRPIVECTTGQAVTVKQGKWKYLDTELTFDSKGNCTNATDNGINYSKLFKLSTDGTYTLTIIGDLASKENTANDLLTFTCSASVRGGQEQTLTGHVTVVISPISTGSYDGHVSAESLITKGSDGIDVTLTLMYGAEQQDKFKYAIVKAGTAPTAASMKTATSKKVTVANAITKDMVDGKSTFLVYFYADGETNPDKYVDCDGFSVLDMNDEYVVDYYYDDITNEDIQDDKGVTIHARLMDQTKGVEITPVTANYTHRIFLGNDENQGNWKLVRTVSGGTTLTITSTDSDYEYKGNMVLNDVTVVGECNFTI